MLLLLVEIRHLRLGAHGHVLLQERRELGGVGGGEGPGARQLEGEAGHGGGGGEAHLSLLLQVVVLHHSLGLGEGGQVLQLVIPDTLRTVKYIIDNYLLSSPPPQPTTGCRAGRDRRNSVGGELPSAGR